MASASTIKTRLFIISDTHSSSNGRDTHSTLSFRPPFPKADVLIHTGDLTRLGTPNEYKAAMELLHSIPAELKLVIAGNHDLSLDKDYYLGSATPDGRNWAQLISGNIYDSQQADIARNMWNGPISKEFGITYLTEGIHRFVLSNGAQLTVYASPWQPEFWNWAFNYAHNEDRWNPPELISKVPFPKDTKLNIIPALRDPHPIPEGQQVDIVMTHGPPWMHRDECKPYGTRAGCPQLLQAMERVRPRVHCFGHIHEGWGAERVSWPKRGQVSTVQPVWAVGPDKLGENTRVLGEIVDATVGKKPDVQTPVCSDVIERKAAYLDVSATSEEPLSYGEETLLINSSIMSRRYDPTQAAWMIDLELPAHENQA